MRLVISEKPSVAADLARVMDPTAKRAEGCIQGQYATWTWALGHLVELCPPEHYQPSLTGKWTLEALPVLPEHHELRAREGRAGQLAVIKRLLAKADELIIATDAGREGELIAAYILDLCPFRGPIKRLWLSESTPAAVKAAFGALRQPMTALEAAARARSEADWAVGMNATMALSARHGGLWSAGRVQTPTLALLVEREKAIRDFKPEPYFVVLADFEAQSARYAGRWFRGEADRLPTLAEAEALAGKVRDKTGTVAKVERKRTSESAPRLFNLTDLQRAANARHGLTAAATLKVAQALYEEHKLLTYPRTDSRHVSADTAATFPARLHAVAAAGLPAPLGPIAQRLAANPGDPGKRVVDDSKVSDHHALLPTARQPDLSRLSPDEAKVYDLVVRRFLAALLPPAAWDETAAVTEIVGETFRSRSRVLVTAGWREVEPPAAAATPARGKGADRSGLGGEPDADGDEQHEQDDTAGDLSGLRQGAASRCLDAKAEARQTKPPARYTEAGLLRAMETAGRLVEDEELAEAMAERGLGTPATRAAIIETLVKREYIQRQKKALVPTPKGETLVRLAPAELRDVATTGEWERRLREIEGGRESAEAFTSGIADLTQRIVSDVAQQERVTPTAAADRESIGKCPKCGGAVIEGKKGYGCANWRPEAGGCRWVIWKEVAGKTLTPGQARELLAKGETSKPVRGFKSRAGKTFEARLKLDPGTGRVEFVFDSHDFRGQGMNVKTTGLPSPRPNRERKLSAAKTSTSRSG